MAGKKKAELISDEEADALGLQVVKPIDIITHDFQRTDLNEMRDKINEIINLMFGAPHK